MDELGVLLYGHAGNALWYGSQLSFKEARDLAPYNSATTLQVTSSIVAAMVGSTFILDKVTVLTSRDETETVFY